MRISILLLGETFARSLDFTKFAVGDYYWNHYSNVGLKGWANKKLYDNFEFAQNECIEMASLCAGTIFIRLKNVKLFVFYNFFIGVTKESGGYTLRSELIFQNEDDHETWVKVGN